MAFSLFSRQPRHHKSTTANNRTRRSTQNRPLALESLERREMLASDFGFAVQMGGAGSDLSYAIASDAAGNTYTTGSFEGTADFDPGAGVTNLTSEGGRDAFVTKLDGEGGLLWTFRIGSSYHTEFSNNIATDSSGNVFVVGGFRGTVDFDPGSGVANLASPDEENMFVAKYDANGNYVWAKAVGGDASPVGYGLDLDSSGNLYIGGAFSAHADFDPGTGNSATWAQGSRDAFILKLDPLGDFLWVKRFGGSRNDLVQDIAVDDAGDVYSTGYFTGTVDFDPGAGSTNLSAATSTDVDAFVVKLNSDGNFLWARNMGGTSWDLGFAMALDTSGPEDHIYVTGRFEGTADFDPGAGVANLTSAGGYDVFLSKLDADGDFVWAKNMGGTGNEEAFAVVADASGNVYTTGRYSGANSDFDPGTGTAYLSTSPVSNKNLFVSQLDSSGDFGWVMNMGGHGDDRGEDLSVDPTGNVYVTGYFESNAVFDPDPATANLTSAGLKDVFLVKLVDAPVTPDTIDEAIADLPPTPPPAGYEIPVSASLDNLDEWILAIGGDGTTENPGLPESPYGSEVVTIAIELDAGDYGGVDIAVPDGYRLVINGDAGSVVFTGASPALTVTSGDVLVLGNVIFTNTTAAPTILVEGGSLTLRDSVVEETTGGDFAAIRVTGGSLDLGTASDLGGNTINIRGPGEAIRNDTAGPISALGNSFEIDGSPITSVFEIEDEIHHAFDSPGLGEVAYFSGNLAPQVEAGPDETATVGMPVAVAGQFEDLNVGDTHTILWDFGDGTTASSLTVSHVFSASGSYTVSLTVTDNHGESGVDTKTITVEQPIPPLEVTAVTVNDGHVQRSMVTSITVSFSQTVSLDQQAFELVDSDGIAVPVTATLSPDAADAVLTFGGSSLADGVYDLTIKQTGVEGATGAELATDYLFAFHRLFGDSDGDGDVDGRDYYNFRLAYFGLAPSLVDAFDSDEDGAVDYDDYLEFYPRFGTVI